MKKLDQNEFFEKPESSIEIFVDENNCIYYKRKDDNFYCPPDSYLYNRAGFKKTEDLPKQYNYDCKALLVCICGNKSFHIFNLWEEGSDFKCTNCGRASDK